MVSDGDHSPMLSYMVIIYCLIVQKKTLHHLLERCAKKMENWPDYIPSPLTIWLELAEDAERE